MYAQVCACPNITFMIGVFGRYLSSPRQRHWKTANKILRYLQGTRDLILTYRHTGTLDVVDFNDSDNACYINDKKSIYG